MVFRRPRRHGGGGKAQRTLRSLRPSVYPEPMHSTRTMSLFLSTTPPRGDAPNAPEVYKIQDMTLITLCREGDVFVQLRLATARRARTCTVRPADRID